jgi:hypothetical protein
MTVQAKVRAVSGDAMSVATTTAPFVAVRAFINPDPGLSRPMVNSNRHYLAALRLPAADEVTESGDLAPDTLRLFGLLGIRHRGWWINTGSPR